MVTGAVAQLCQISSSLKLNPRLIKAVLLAGTKITDSMNEDEVITQTGGNIALSKQYGSGMLNVINSYALYSVRKIIHLVLLLQQQTPLQNDEYKCKFREVSKIMCCLG